MLISTRNLMRGYLFFVVFGLVCMAISINVEGAGTWSDNDGPLVTGIKDTSLAHQLPTFNPEEDEVYGAIPKQWVRYKALNGLPSDLRLGWYSGYLSGTPLTSTTTTFTYQAKVWQADAKGEIATRQITITTTVSSPPVQSSDNLEVDPSDSVTDDPVDIEADHGIIERTPPVPSGNNIVNPPITQNTELAPSPAEGAGTVVPTNVAPVETSVRVTRPIRVSCPVGWQQQTPFGFPTPRVLIRAVEVEVDLTHHSIYTPIAIEIYKEPNETRENLEGWKLTLAVPYNIGIDYPLTAENSEFDASGVLRIESSDVPGGLPMTNISFSGQSLPGFDYRLFDELNQRVDFGISCYYHARANLTGRLELMESPRVERELAYESLTWDTYYLNNWEIPLETETGSPGAPSLIPVKLTTSWASLKKRSDL